LTFPFLQNGKITGLDDPYVEFIRMRGIAPEGIPADKRTEALLMVGVYEYRWFQAISSPF
jgi:hypothetical protein